MVEAMVQLARGLGMTPLAEGIERPGELEFLRRAGCTRGQGFLFALSGAGGGDPAALARATLLPVEVGSDPRS